jgi:hypothetical protein
MEPLNEPPRTLAVYSVIPQPDGRHTYLRIGGGYGDLRDPHGVTLLFDAIPLHGKVLVRSAEPADRRLNRRRPVGAAL